MEVLSPLLLSTEMFQCLWGIFRQIMHVQVSFLLLVPNNMKINYIKMNR